MNRQKLLIIIPAYNEADNIVGVVKELMINYPQYDYITDMNMLYSWMETVSTVLNL